MGTLIIVSACILLATAIIGLSIWAGDSQTDQDTPDAAGITSRERMDAIR
jgi:hypothetical protein